MPANDPILQAIAGTALDAVVATDRLDKVVFWNSHAERLFGRRAEEVKGQLLHRLIIPERYRQRHIEGVERFNATGQVHRLGRRLEVSALDRSGAEIPVEMAVMIAPRSGGDVFVAFLRDLRPQKEAERRIAELQSEVVHLSRVNAMSTMASVLAHELNQPLTAAASYLRSALKLKDLPPLEGAPSPWEAVASAERSVMRAGETIRSIREMVSDEARGRENVSLRELIAETERLLAGTLVVRPAFHCAEGADCVVVSRIQIEQVLLNLLRNASEALSGTSDPSIEINARPDQGHVRITVTDNGPGLPPEVKERLFSTAPSRKEAGMGIGLSVCRTIIEQHEGKIWHHQTGGRTSFSFTVPSGTCG
jgi:two-component system sensor kinase FixL